MIYPKKSIFIFSLMLFLINPVVLFSQDQFAIEKISVDESSFDNIFVKNLAEDSLSSSFIIWVKNNVPLHKHEFHTEYVYVLEGSGMMQLGDKKINIKVGDLIHIPANTAHDVSEVNSKHPLKVISIQMPYFDGNDRVSLGEKYKAY